MKKTSVLVLILVLLLVPMLSLYSCNNNEGTATVIGEVAYVKDTADHPLSSNNYYYVYVIPYGEKDSWVLFNISRETSTESEFSLDITQMPELAIGNMVEIVYDTVPRKDELQKTSYHAVSIKKHEGSVDKSYSIPLVLRENYDFKSNDGGVFEDYGKVVHITRVNQPIGGYLIYLEESDESAYTLGCFWVEDGKTIVTPEIMEKIKAGEVGYYIYVKTLSNTNPFTANDAVALMSIYYR